MDTRLRQLDHRVAATADAWLADPTDAGLYTRLINAIIERRAYLHPDLEVTLDPIVPPATQPDELLDELEQHRPPTQIGEVLNDDGPKRPRSLPQAARAGEDPGTGGPVSASGRRRLRRGLVQAVAAMIVLPLAAGGGMGVAQLDPVPHILAGAAASLVAAGAVAMLAGVLLSVAAVAHGIGADGWFGLLRDALSAFVHHRRAQRLIAVSCVALLGGAALLAGGLALAT